MFIKETNYVKKDDFFGVYDGCILRIRLFRGERGMAGRRCFGRAAVNRQDLQLCQRKNAQNAAKKNPSTNFRR